MARYAVVALSIALTISIVVSILLSLYCFHCQVMNVSCDALFAKYRLDPLVSLATSLAKAPKCESFQEMYARHREAMFKLYGDPASDASRFAIRTLSVEGRRIRVFRADDPVGICVFIHGGGWTIGGYDEQDRDLAELARRTKQTVCSLDYRLIVQSPDNRYPAAPDDCERLSAYIVSNPREVEPSLNRTPVFTI